MRLLLDSGVIGSMTLLNRKLSQVALRTMPILIGVASACSTSDAPPFGTEGAACPNDNNCFRPLQCIEGFCRSVEGPDGGVPDGGQNP
ncbi:MAG: hypothetical protein AAFV29_27190, partial [Myxococcota bacterium]